MVRRKTVSLTTDLTEFNNLPDNKISTLKNYLIYNTRGNSWKPLDELGVWRVRIICELHDSMHKQDNTYIVETKFEDVMSYLDALTIAVRMFDAEYMEDYALPPTDAKACNKLTRVKAIAATL